MNKRRNSWLARLLVLALACSIALTFAIDGAPAAHAQATTTNIGNISYLGTMDLMGYCRNQGYVSVRTVGNTYYSWRCITSAGGDVVVSMRSVCQWQYRTSNAWDYSSNFYSATSGTCWSGNLLGTLNLRAYCQSQGYLDVTLIGSTVYDWRCVESVFGGTFTINVVINMDDTCQWEYGGNTLGRFDNFNDATSERCIG